VELDHARVAKICLGAREPQLGLSATITRLPREEELAILCQGRAGEQDVFHLCEQRLLRRFPNVSHRSRFTTAPRSAAERLVRSAEPHVLSLARERAASARDERE